MRTLLTVVAIALGVAVVLAIELAGNAATGSFRSSVESLTGDADFEVSATGSMPASVLTKLALLPDPLALHPRIEDYALIQESDRTVPLLGLDLLNEAAPNTVQRFEPGDFEDGVWAGAQLGLQAGQRIHLLVNDTLTEFKVSGVLGASSGELLVMDLSTAARLLGRDGALDRVLVKVPAGKNTAEWQQALDHALPSSITVAPLGTRTGENQRMLEAFRWNLRVLSYIALVVGAFLIYNTVSVSVVRRRPEIGIVRALGVSRAGVLWSFLGEAAVMGVIGSLIGVALGRFMAESAVKLVSGTVESLYVSSRPAPIELTLSLVLLSLAAGVAVAMVSAFAPAWEASLVSPVEAMARGRREHVVRIRYRVLSGVALVLAIAGGIASQQEPLAGKPIFGYIAAVLWISAAALAIPALITLAVRGGRILQRLFGIEALLAVRSLAGSMRRTAVLVGALTTAIAMMAAVAIMVGSFRQTVLVWMNDRLQADLYLRPAGTAGADRHPTFSAEAADRIEKLPEVAAVDRFRAYPISYGGLPATLGAGDARVISRYATRPLLSHRSSQDVFTALIGTDRALVSEPFANKHHVKTGDVLDIPMGERRVKLQVVDIYNDYSSERGYIIVDRGTLLKYLPDPNPSNAAVYLKPGVDLEQARLAVERALRGRHVVVFSNRTLREEAIKIFDRTFAITYALEAVAVFVAVMGVAGALIALVIDRRRELGLLRFLGTAQTQMRRLILFEAGLLGLLGNIAGVMLGLALSLLLIFVINKQSFGWTIQFHWPVAVLLGALSVVYGATILAALYPAKIATRLNPIEAVHEE